MPHQMYPRPPFSPQPRAARGFTLIEVMVALFIMAILAAMAWQGVDGLVRVRDGAQGSAERTLQMATVISQWEQDLQQLQASPGAPPLRFDGSALRLTRRAPDGLMLVVWTRQDNTLYRWASPPVTRLQDLQEWWLRSQQWTSLRESALPMLTELSNWQVFYYRQGDNSWSNAQSSGNKTVKQVVTQPPGDPPPENVNPNPDEEDLPVGVRVVLSVPSGTLTRDLQLQGTQGSGG
ncbi:MAG TPA: prepilin-type N-terminal cleavage/methylation domain-containing protein [Ideonella sp.]|uniref:PulJ/GspJ family protein n=1 Tax=Ideonella sp. TaxID=1929293 RepID=UPI002CD5449B|nr:prepilin-type N-terminal cleavage/methylation domain-containing protein [Ideonella sp.]HSI49760.1 prepilin-type N-terminal cleavage/methylation domain-containing protein [Ideonella sp.]